MLELAHPWLLAMLPLPIIMQLLPPYRESRESVKVPFFNKLASLSEIEPTRGSLILRRNRLQHVLIVFMWVCLIAGASKPEWVSAPLEQQKTGRDLMLAVDLSGSMATQDFALPNKETLNRLQAVKSVLRELASERPSDRLGLIVFGSSPYLQSPFTEDHTIWSSLLEETEIGMAGQSTMFGDAIGLAIKLFRESDSDNRVLIILTDGNDTGSVVPPIEAAKVAAENNVRIYIIAIGDPATIGEDALDLQTITTVAQTTGGAHFQALNQRELNTAYATIAELEPNIYETISYQTRQSLHWLPPALGLFLFTLYHLAAAWRFSTANNQRVA
ncbi:MAG: VWA domain-containing protein [Halioglobus sp.]